MPKLVAAGLTGDEFAKVKSGAVLSTAKDLDTHTVDGEFATSRYEVIDCDFLTIHHCCFITERKREGDAFFAFFI